LQTSAVETGNRFLDRLSPADLAALAPHLARVELPQGRVLFEQDDAIEHVHFLTSGVLSSVVVLSDGRSVEALMIGREGVVGSEVHSGPVRAWARGVVQISGAAERVQADRFREIVERRPGLRVLIQRYAVALHAELQLATACNAVHRLEQRLAKWLLRSADRVEGSDLNLTQEYLGHMLGAQRTTVTQVAGLLQKRGLIDYQRGRVTIRDRAGLERTACECYALARRRTEELAEA